MASRLSQEEENYVRMSLLLTEISPRAARTLFDKEFVPSFLGFSLKKEYNKLIDLRNKREINQCQWNLLFPRFPGVPCSKTFDVMLIITLLGNLTYLSPPRGGYDMLPSANETTSTSDLARINYYRHFLARLDEGKVDNTTFTIAWDNVVDAIIRLGGQQMKQECDDLKVRKLDQTNQKIMLDNKRSNGGIMELKKLLESFKKSNEDMTIEIEKLITSPKITIPNKDIKGIGETDQGFGESDLDEPMELIPCGKCKRNLTLLADFMKHKETCNQVEAFTEERMAITRIFKAVRPSSLSENAEVSHTESITDSSGYGTDDRSSSRVRRLPNSRGMSMSMGGQKDIPIPHGSKTYRYRSSSSRPAVPSPFQEKLYKRKIPEVDDSLETKSMEMYQSNRDFSDDGSESEEQIHRRTRHGEGLATVLHQILDVGGWKEGGRRCVMLQQQPNPDTPSSHPLTSPSQTETQQNGHQITSGASGTQTQQMPPRPGSGPGPSQGPGMSMEPMEIYLQYRMMASFMRFPPGYPSNYQSMPPRLPYDASESFVFSDDEGDDKEGKGEKNVRKPSKSSEEEKGKNEDVKNDNGPPQSREAWGQGQIPPQFRGEPPPPMDGRWIMNTYDLMGPPPRRHPPYLPPYRMHPGPLNQRPPVSQPAPSMSPAVTPTKKPVEDDDEVWRQKRQQRKKEISDVIERVRLMMEDEEKKIEQDRKDKGESDTKYKGRSSRTTSESSEKDSRERSYSREQHKFSPGEGTNKTSSRTVPPRFQRQQSDQQMPPRSQPQQQPGSPQPHPAQMRPAQSSPPWGLWPLMPFMGYGSRPPMDISNMPMYPPVRRRNDSHGSGTESQDNDGKHDYERDPRAWQNYPVPPHLVPLLMYSLVCDGHAIDCIIDRRLAEYYSMPRKTTKDFLKLKEDIEKGQKNDFQNLIMVSTLFKERKQCSISLSRELLILSVKTKQDLLCRLLLSYITDRANQLPDLLEVLLIAMEEEQNHSANAIAWLITKTFVLEYKVVLRDCILDVWPAFKCKCKGEYEKRVCSSHVVIVVELESEINNERIPDKYFSVEVVFLTNGTSNEKNTKTELQVSDVHFADDKPITGLSAGNLFAKHRKLTLISKSSFHQHGIEKQCVNLFCRVKGLIPIGENHLPRSFCSLPTKIQQGMPQLMTNIRVGDKIGTDDFKKGTLGGFLKVRGDKVFLTCLHILLSTEDLASENITLNDEQPLSIKCYPAGESSTASNTTSYVCGKIRDIAFKTDNCGSTSIDAALIKVKKGIEICPTDYAVTGNENTINHGQIGLQSPFLNNNCVDFRKFCYTHPKPSVTTVSVGAVSGMNEVGSEILENRAFGTDLEPFHQSFDNVFLDGIKHIATCVIESIRKSRNPFIPLEKQIMDTVEDQGKGHFPTETIQNIAKIVYEVCTKTGSNGQGDAKLEVNELLHKATFDRTSSSFSAIVGDVHLQTTFLKWTVDRETSKRTSRKMYGQIHISNIPFQPGDSGSCIYVTHPEKGCIGLAIANHPHGGCIATPIMEILKHFNIRHGPNQ